MCQIHVSASHSLALPKPDMYFQNEAQTGYQVPATSAIAFPVPCLKRTMSHGIQAHYGTRPNTYLGLKGGYTPVSRTMPHGIQASLRYLLVPWTISRGFQAPLGYILVSRTMSSGIQAPVGTVTVKTHMLFGPLFWANVRHFPYLVKGSKLWKVTYWPTLLFPKWSQTLALLILYLSSNASHFTNSEEQPWNLGPMRWVSRLLTITVINKPGHTDPLESRPLPFKPVGEGRSIQTKVVELVALTPMGLCGLACLSLLL